MRACTVAELNKRYGNPKGKNGKVNPAWERDNIVTMKLPYPMRLAWDTKQVVKTVRVHKDVADKLKATLTDIWNYVRVEVKTAYGYNQKTFFYDRKTLERIRTLGLDLYGGAYNYRNIRGGTGLSTHSWGGAFDLDPEHNALGTTGRFAKTQKWVVEIWENRGWFWGGRWKRKDAMHFEVAFSEES